jgi:hypothetical protein
MGRHAEMPFSALLTAAKGCGSSFKKSFIYSKMVFRDIP